MYLLTILYYIYLLFFNKSDEIKQIMKRFELIAKGGLNAILPWYNNNLLPSYPLHYCLVNVNLMQLLLSFYIIT